MKTNARKTNNPRDWHVNHKIAVYGTLKSGFCNHWRLEDCIFLGKGQTKELFPLVIDGLPYLVDKPGTGHKVAVEIYRVDDTYVRDALDQLENHPRWYCRRQIDVETWAGGMMAWVYMMPEAMCPVEGKTLHESYRQQR